MTKTEANESFNNSLAMVPARIADALCWARDTLGMARRMLEAEGIEVTAAAAVELVRIVTARECELRAREREEARDEAVLTGTHLRGV